MAGFNGSTLTPINSNNKSEVRNTLDVYSKSETNNAIAQSTANVFKLVENGNVTAGHSYLLLLEDSSINSSMFTVLYNPSDNQGIQHFSVCLTNGTNIYCCVAKIALSNGQLSISDAYRIETSSPGIDAWIVNIRLIRMIA